MPELKGFIAYSSDNSTIGDTIELAIKRFDENYGQGVFKSWKQNDAIGQFVISPIVHNIDRARCLVADITVANPNVIYEIGYAIGSRTKVFPIQNKAVTADSEKISKAIAFDTILTERIANSDELYEFLNSDHDFTPMPITRSPDRDVPLYLLYPPVLTDSWGQIISHIKPIGRFKEFDPNEQSRLPVFEAIENVASSFGVVIPFLTPDMTDAETHNLRASLIAGLARGMGRVTLLVQSGEGELPADFRDYVKQFRSSEQLVPIIDGFASRVFGQTQRDSSVVDVDTSDLSTLNIGSTIAEYEFNHLADYYVLTDPFHRAMRGEVRIVVGRKGTGKSALFFQVRNKLREERNTVVLDLMPEGYQLLKLRNQVLNMLDEGTKEHTLVAFWEYILLVEVCYKLLEMDHRIYARDSRLVEPFEALHEVYGSEDFERRADFSERLRNLINRISEQFSSKYGGEENINLDNDQITEIIFGKDIRELRRSVLQYLTFKDGLWILFDNLDKGWSTRGISREDLVIVRTLLDASRKLERQIGKGGFECHTLIFIRNDVLELLLDETPDHGKETRVNLDWSEPDLLLEVLRRRFVNNGIDETKSIDQIWTAYCVPTILGRDSLKFFVDRSLMRPRFLLSFFNHARGFAVNRGHIQIQEDDIISGLSSFSDDLLIDISLELRDVFPAGENLPYVFIGVKPEIQRSDILKLMERYGVSDVQIDQAIEILLWHSVLGIKKSDGTATYVHNESYDMRRLRMLMRDTNVIEPAFVIHPAFWPSLNIDSDIDQLGFQFGARD